MESALNQTKREPDGCCNTCEFWQRDKSAQAPLAMKGGFCRARPPQVVVVYGANALGQQVQAVQPAWPPTLSTDWCGDYEPKEDASANGTPLTSEA